MQDLGAKHSRSSTTLHSDAALREYMQDKMRGANTDFDRSPILEYASRRDFSVEPLETETAAFLVNVLLENTSAQAADDYVLTCWAPCSAEALHALQSQLGKWGYAVVGVSRTNRSVNRTPLMECTAQPSPDMLEQFRAISSAGLGADALLDGWAIVVQNRHRPPEDEVSIHEWAAVRGVPVAEVTENISALGDALQEQGGIPGTQWAIQSTEKDA